LATKFEQFFLVELGTPLQLLLPDVSHENQSAKHMMPSARGSAPCWYDVGHTHVKLMPIELLVVRPPTQKVVLLVQFSPKVLQPLAVSLRHAASEA
jgi:hypothetical protein